MENVGWVLLALSLIGALGAVSRDPRVPATWRFVARQLEGDLYRDELGQEWFLPFF
jgi:hypothetical protein